MWVCPRCGNSNRDEGRFCDNCAMPKPDLTFEREMSTATTGRPEDRIKDAVVERSRTDRRVSNGWVLLAILGFWATGGTYIVVIFIYLGSWLHVDIGEVDERVFEWAYIYSRYVAMALFGAFFTILAYKLLNRLNLHNQREENLRASVMAYLKARPRPPNSDPEIVDQLISLSAYDGQAMIYERRLNARNWAYGIGVILFFAGISGLTGTWLVMNTFRSYFDLWPYQFIFQMASSVLSLVGLIALLALASHLMKTIYTHSVRWTGFSNSTSVALSKLGTPMKIPLIRSHIQERSLVLYAVATIVTLGLFGFYWLYVLIDDPQKHFDAQHPFEDLLLRAIM